MRCWTSESLLAQWVMSQHVKLSNKRTLLSAILVNQLLSLMMGMRTEDRHLLVMWLTADFFIGHFSDVELNTTFLLSNNDPSASWGSTMDNSFDYEPIEDFKEELLTNGPASAAAKIQEYLDQQDNIPLNIGITGESGSGKSTFVNAFRGIDNRDERAAPTGPVETTSEATPYPYPIYPNVTLWDLPGIGTLNFSASNYLEHVEFEKFDFFIIISADRFRENDVKLAQEIQRMKKKF
ncbi:T-cell-specific guanine nucleotide triphosphate-binding protein 2-like [Epinephelus lanceolatus]